MEYNPLQLEQNLIGTQQNQPNISKQFEKEVCQNNGEIENKNQQQIIQKVEKMTENQLQCQQTNKIEQNNLNLGAKKQINQTNKMEYESLFPHFQKYEQLQKQENEYSFDNNKIQKNNEISFDFQADHYLPSKSQFKQACWRLQDHDNLNNFEIISSIRYPQNGKNIQRSNFPQMKQSLNSERINIYDIHQQSMRQSKREKTIQKKKSFVKSKTNQTKQIPINKSQSNEQQLAIDIKIQREGVIQELIPTNDILSSSKKLIKSDFSNNFLSTSHKLNLTSSNLLKYPSCSNILIFCEQIISSSTIHMINSKILNPLNISSRTCFQDFSESSMEYQKKFDSFSKMKQKMILLNSNKSTNDIFQPLSWVIKVNLRNQQDLNLFDTFDFTKVRKLSQEKQNIKISKKISTFKENSKFHNMNKLLMKNILSMFQEENLENFEFLIEDNHINCYDAVNNEEKEENIIAEMKQIIRNKLSYSHISLENNSFNNQYLSTNEFNQVDNIQKQLKSTLIEVVIKLKFLSIRSSQKNTFEYFSKEHYHALFLRITEKNLPILRLSERDCFIHLTCYRIDLQKNISIYEQNYLNLCKTLFYQILIHCIQPQTIKDDHSQSKKNLRRQYCLKAIQGIFRLFQGEILVRF